MSASSLEGTGMVTLPMNSCTSAEKNRGYTTARVWDSRSEWRALFRRWAMRKSPDLYRQPLGRRHHDSAGNHTFALWHANPRSRSMSYGTSAQRFIIMGGYSDSSERGFPAVNLASDFGEEVERHSRVQGWEIL